MHLPRRRAWFRVSLRSLFVFVTLVCVFLSWQLNIVRQRKLLLDTMRAERSLQVIPASGWSQIFNGKPPSPIAKVSAIRRWLGDEAIQEIWYPWNTPLTPSELERLKQAFPEAELNEIVPEPCHPGCFPIGTLVDTPSGPCRIECVGPGDVITCIVGKSHSAGEVQSVFVTENRLWRVETTAGELMTTETQPLVLNDYSVEQAGHLEPGDCLLKLNNGVVQPVEVLRVRPTRCVEQVYNVILGNSEILVANGFLARSKPPKRPSAE